MGKVTVRLPELNVTLRFPEGTTDEQIMAYLDKYLSNPAANPVQTSSLNPMTPAQKFKSLSLLKKMKPAQREAIQLESIRRVQEKQRQQDEGVGQYFLDMMSNIPRNAKEVITGTATAIAMVPALGYKFGKDVWSDVTQAATTDDWSFAETTKDIRKVYNFIDQQFQQLQKEFITKEGKINVKAVTTWIKEHPVDTFLMFGNTGWTAAGKGLSTTARLVERAGVGGEKVASWTNRILSTKRTPLVYEIRPQYKELTDTVLENLPELAKDKEKLTAALEGVPPQEVSAVLRVAAAELTDEAANNVLDVVKQLERADDVRKITFPREYSDNPLTKMLLQESFDYALEKFPKLKQMLVERNVKKSVRQLRYTYDKANFNERNELIAEGLSRLDKLTPAEQDFLVPYLEGRASLLHEPSEQFQEFTNWYKRQVRDIQDDLVQRGKLTPEQIENRIWQPLSKAVGKSVDEIKDEFGDFHPTYVHHDFTHVFGDKTSRYFADTTGKRFKPGFLKRSKGAWNYSENMKKIWPHFAADYVKMKNTEAYLTELTSKYGIKTNISKIKTVEGGLEVDGKLFPDYKIVAPDGILSFYKWKIDLYKEINNAAKDLTFDEAIAEGLSKLKDKLAAKEGVGVSKNKTVYLVPDTVYKELESFGAPAFGSQKIQNVIRLAWDKPTQVWKDLTLGVSPRWLANNIMGDLFISIMEGVGPFEYGRAFRGVYEDLIPKALTNESFFQVMKYNPKLGRTAETGIVKFIDRFIESHPGIKAGARAATKVKNRFSMYTVGSAVETPFLKAVYIQQAKKLAKKQLRKEGRAVTEHALMSKLRAFKNDPNISQQLIRKTFEIVPSGELLNSPFARKYLKRMVPFINFYYWSAQYMSKLPARHPFKVAALDASILFSEKTREDAFKAVFEGQDDLLEEIDTFGLPERFDGLWPLKRDQETGEVHFLDIRSANLFGPMEGLLPPNREAFGMLHPVLKTSMEWVFGGSFYSGRKFISKNAVRFDSYGHPVYEAEAKPNYVNMLLENIPGYRIFENIRAGGKQYAEGTLWAPAPIKDPLTGEIRYPVDGWQQALNFLGIPVKKDDWDEAFRKYIKKRRADVSRQFTAYLTDGYITRQEFNEIMVEVSRNPKVRKRVSAERNAAYKKWRERQEKIQQGVAK